MAVTSWLIDKSAYVRLQLGQAANRDQWNARISRGLVRLSTITRLELGYSARSGDAGRRQFGSPPLSLMPIEHLTPAIEDRAFQVQMLLARPTHRGHRRESGTDRPRFRQGLRPHRRNHRPARRNPGWLSRDQPAANCTAFTPATRRPARLIVHHGP
jgi:predicted nucleic acid-binding protein